MDDVRFFAEGQPIPQGSKRGFVVNGRVVLVEAGGKAHKDWRKLVAAMAADAMTGEPPWTGPVCVRLVFSLPRPKSHPKGRVTWPAARFDVDKLARSVLDSMTKVVFVDDGQVVRLLASKVWAGIDTSYPPGVQVRVWVPLADAQLPLANRAKVPVPEPF